jgi:hypothetical protein
MNKRGNVNRSRPRGRWRLIGQSSFALRATEDTILRLMVSSLGLPSEARLKGERRMVDQILTSWNRIKTWLKRVRELNRAVRH